VSVVTPGNHVVMLTMEMSRELIDLTDRWVTAAPEKRQRKASPHMTVCFVGKNLTEDDGKVILDVTRRHADDAPRFVASQSHLRMFGKDRNCLVVLMTASIQLIDFRQHILENLKAANVDVKEGGWSYNPHVTLAEGVKDDEMPQSRVRGYSLAVKNVCVKIGETYHVIKEFA